MKSIRNVIAAALLVTGTMFMSSTATASTLYLFDGDTIPSNTTDTIVPIIEFTAAYPDYEIFLAPSDSSFLLEFELFAPSSLPPYVLELSGSEFGGLFLSIPYETPFRVHLSGVTKTVSMLLRVIDPSGASLPADFSFGYDPNNPDDYPISGISGLTDTELAQALMDFDDGTAGTGTSVVPLPAAGWFLVAGLLRLRTAARRRAQ